MNHNKISHKRSYDKKRLFHKHVMAAFIIIVLCAAAIFGIFKYKPLMFAQLGKTAASSGQAESSKAKTSSAKSSQQVKKPVSITVLGAGDDLIHDSLYKQASTRANGKGYDFTPVYGHVAGQIKKADIAVINQETVLAGNVAPLSGYPLFNSPTAVGDTLVNIGFDVINHANNHVLDQGEKGVKATLDYWDTKPVKVVGVYRNDADMENIRIVEAKGIKTAHIGITEMTNGLYLPKGSKYKIVMASDTELIEHLIKKAKSMADVVVISVHWGTENTYELTDAQKTLAQEMVDWGADIIFGNHPHVVQKLTLLTRASDGAQCPVIFALGNFVSAQLSGKNMVSGLLTVTETKDCQTGKTSYNGMKFTPLVTQYGKHCSNITIYPFSEYTDKMASEHGVRKYTPSFSKKFIQDIIDKNIPKEYQDE